MVTTTRYRSTTTARVVYAITGLVVGIIVLGILLVLADANPANMLVNLILDVANWLTTPFHGLFPRRDPDQSVLVNWGLAALVYLIIGSAIARFARR
jgi:hypothetical protein